jgi:uncharacterized FlgJ-related protein
MSVREYRLLFMALVCAGSQVIGCAANKNSGAQQSAPPPTSSNPALAEAHRGDSGQAPQQKLRRDENRALVEDMLGQKRSKSDAQLAAERDVVEYESGAGVAIRPVGEPVEVDGGMTVPPPPAPSKAKPRVAGPADVPPPPPPPSAHKAQVATRANAIIPPAPPRPSNLDRGPEKMAEKTVGKAGDTPSAPAKPAEGLKPAEHAKLDKSKPMPDPASAAASSAPVANGPTSVTPAKAQIYGSFDLKVCERLSLAARDLSFNMSAVQTYDGELPATLPFDYYRDLEKTAHERGLQMNPAQLRKNHFVCTLIPIVARLNATVFRQRLEVLRVDGREKKGLVTKAERLWMEQIKSRYGLSVQATTADVLRLVDVVPDALILAVAAEATEWGTSESAKATNNLFGLAAKKGSERRTYKYAVESVGDFIEFMNSANESEFAMLKRFRDARGRLRTEAKALDSLVLADAMEGFPGSAGGKYVAEIKAILRGWNNYNRFELRESELRSW